MKFLESIWFKVAITMIPMIFIVGAVGFFVLREMGRQERAMERAAEMRTADLEWEKKHRGSMVRIYQNLKLDHFLAAYRNFEAIDPPASKKPSFYAEYYETLNRTAEGLLKDEFLDESEEAYRELQRVREYEDLARAQIARIAILRRLGSARSFLKRGIELVEQERYQDAKGELQKAKLELRSVKLFGADDISKEEAELTKYSRIAMHQVYLADARMYLERAKRQMVLMNFDIVVNEMQYAAGNTGKAAFFNPESKEVEELRQELVELQAELQYVVPNSIPIFNLYSESQALAETQFFRLEGYDFELDPGKEGFIHISVKYRMKTTEEGFYIVRYQAFTFDGRQFFNGHFLKKKDETEGDQIKEIVYSQQIPKELLSTPIKRVDLRIYDSNDRMLSRVTRAFRAPDSN